jgi:hypothetical protein
VTALVMVHPHWLLMWQPGLQPEMVCWQLRQAHAPSASTCAHVAQGNGQLGITHARGRAREARWANLL